MHSLVAGMNPAQHGKARVCAEVRDGKAQCHAQVSLEILEREERGVACKVPERLLMVAGEVFFCLLLPDETERRLRLRAQGRQPPSQMVELPVMPTRVLSNSMSVHPVHLHHLHPVSGGLLGSRGA